MMNEQQARDAITRLKKIEGQVRGIIKMIENGRYCMDILSQTRAIVSGIRGVENKIMYQHLHTCVADTMKSDNQDDKRNKINEIMDVFTKFGRGV